MKLQYLKKNNHFLKKIINKLKKNKIRVSLFVEPNIYHIDLSKNYGANCVELHTGKFCNLFNKNKNIKLAFLNIKRSSIYAKKIGLDVHAGHGLTYKSAEQLSKIKSISEFNIGHFIIAESIFVTLKNSIRKFKQIINN
mgnify:FL=1